MSPTSYRAAPPRGDEGHCTRPGRAGQSPRSFSAGYFHSAAKPPPKTPECSGSAAPRAPPGTLGAVQPAAPTRPFLVSFAKPSMKPGRFGTAGCPGRTRRSTISGAPDARSDGVGRPRCSRGSAATEPATSNSPATIPAVPEMMRCEVMAFSSGSGLHHTCRIESRFPADLRSTPRVETTRTWNIALLPGTSNPPGWRRLDALPSPGTACGP